MSFCPNCGNQITDNSAFCPNCGTQVNQQPVVQPQPQPVEQPVAQPQPQYNPQPAYQPAVLQNEESKGIYGFGKALAGIILVFFALIFAIYALDQASTASNYYNRYMYNYYYDYYGSYRYYSNYASRALAFSLLNIPLFVLSMVFGGGSIGNFKYAKNNLNQKPTITLIFGICALALGALSGILSTASFIISVGLV